MPQDNVAEINVQIFTLTPAEIGAANILLHYLAEFHVNLPHDKNFSQGIFRHKCPNARIIKPNRNIVHQILKSRRCLPYAPLAFLALVPPP